MPLRSPVSYLHSYCQYIALGLLVLGSRNMITSLNSPFLFIAADAVKDLDGGDALCGLWTG
jgi:hypothetical protein